MLLVRWTDSNRNLWLDLIPLEWLSLRDSDNLKHTSIHLDKEAMVCHCDLRIVNGELHLNYGGRHKAKNMFEAGTSVFHFGVDGTPHPTIGWMVEDSLSTDFAGELIGEMPRFLEGSEKLIQHKKKERSKKLRQLKVALTLGTFGKLTCEACEFDFNEIYGNIARNYCEVHHNEKVAGGEKINGPDDLSILCANCHRAIHQSEKSGDMLTVMDLKRIIDNRII